MAKFKSNTTFYGKQEGREIVAGEEFEVTIKRAEEIVANGKKIHNLDIELTRLDGTEEKQIEVEQNKDAAKTSDLKAVEPKEEPKKEEKKARK